MNRYRAAFQWIRAGRALRSMALVTYLTVAGFLCSAVPVLAHHPSGGETPDSPLEAFLSGVGHPVIGLDHLAFVIAAGLVAAGMGRGLLVPIAFVVASLAGTGMHLMSLNLPALELAISASVLVFGVLLALKSPPNDAVVMGLGAIAGIFHGYAYGEAIIGAEMGPLVAYLLGFTFIQMAIALVAYWTGCTASKQAADPSGLTLRFAGFVICGVGATLITTLVVDAILPV